jgi:uncharacterized membrane protein YGL010W
MNGNSSNTGNSSNLNDKTHVVEQQQRLSSASSSTTTFLLPMVPQTTKGTNLVHSNTTSDVILFYISHLFHASVYYYCIKYIFNTIIIPTNTTGNTDNDNSIISSLAFYGIYHRTPYNQLIHFFGVPFIIWTMLIYGAHLPFTNHRRFLIHRPPLLSLFNKYVVLPQSLQLPKQHRITWATLWIVMYIFFYINMDMIGAILYTPLLYVMYVTSIRFTEYDQYDEYKNKNNQSVNNKKTDQVNDVNHFHWYGTGRLLWKSFIIHIISWYIQIHVGHHIVEGATPASLVNLGAALTAAPLFAFYEGIWFCGLRQQLQQQVIAQVAIYTEQLCASGANLRVCASL